MHSNWVKIRIFEQPLLRKLSAAIEGQPGKRGRDEEGEGSPDKKVAKPEEPAAATADIGLATFRGRSEEHTSELQSLMRNSYDVFCLKKKKKIQLIKFI